MTPDTAHIISETLRNMSWVLFGLGIGIIFLLTGIMLTLGHLLQEARKLNDNLSIIYIDTIEKRKNETRR